MTSKKTIDRVEKLAAERTPQDRQMLHLRRQNTQLRSQLDRYAAELGSQREMTQAVVAAVEAIEPYPRFYAPKATPSGSEVTAVIKFSDWHIGEVIRADETEGFGRFNWKTAQARVFNIVQSFSDWITTQRHAYRINELVVLAEGDFISGNIHEELMVTNEFPLPVQTANAGALLSEAVARLSTHFESVRLVEVGSDNHSRLQRKPQAKQKVANSMLFLVHAVANANLRNHVNVRIVQPRGIKHVENIAGWKFLLEHGDGIKSWLGIPFYGLQREKGREAIKRMQTALGFDYMSIGHWHVPSVLDGNILINGSLSGTSEFDHACGRHAEPAQVSFLVHPEHGFFNWVAWSGKR